MIFFYKALAQIGPTICRIENYILTFISELLWNKVRLNFEPKNILIHRVGKIGDIVCALPSIRAVRNRWPNSHIVLLTNDSGANDQGIKKLLLNLSWIDEIIFYQPSKLKQLRVLLSLAGVLREMKIDFWLSLSQDLTCFSDELRNMIFAKYVNSKNGFGFRTNTFKIFSFFQSNYLKHKYEVKRLQGIVKEIGITNDCLDYGLEDLKIVNKKNEPLEIAITERKKLLVIAPGGSRITNRWPSVRFEEIVKRWVDDGGYVVMMGGGQDYTLAEEIIKKIPVRSVTNLCGITTLEESLQLIRVCKIFLSNDSGPIHLAAAYKIPMVAIFSARDFPGKWFPIHEKSSILRISTNCSPCFLEACNRNNLCLSGISVDDVWNAMRKVESIG
jgi:ADP-heptose:LPS heptosyltransferase